MIYLDLDADLNMEDDNGRNFARVASPALLPAVGDVLVAGRPDFWSWVVIDLDGDAEGEIIYFHQVSARHAASPSTLGRRMPRTG